MRGDEDISYWAGFCAGGIAPQGVAALRADPRCPDVLRRVVANTLRRSDASRDSFNAFPDAGTVMVALVALYLEGSGGFTHSRFRQMAQMSELMSAGRASAILGRLRATGHVAPAETSASGNVLRYTVTAQLIDEFRERFLAELDALCLLDPRVRLAIEALGARDAVIGFGCRFAMLQASAFARIAPALVPFHALIERNVAVRIVMALLEAADDGGRFPAPGDARLSITALARRFRMSRVQVRRILSDMAARGYIVREKRGPIRVEPALAAIFEEYFCSLLIGFAWLAHAMLPPSGEPGRIVLPRPRR